VAIEIKSNLFLSFLAICIVVEFRVAMGPSNMHLKMNAWQLVFANLE